MTAAAVEAAMTQLRAVMLASFCISLAISLPATQEAVNAFGSQQLNPKAAQQYAADSEKASQGDPEAAYRMGEALESGRLGGLKDLHKALLYYRLAAQKNYEDAAQRVTQIEAELSKSQNTTKSAPISRGR
jgi:TPR repeat protein